MTPLSSRHKFILIIAMIFCYAMIFIDESGIAVTLPTMKHALTLSSNAMHWVVNSYLLTLSVLLLLGGKLADIYGTKKIFTVGITIFMLASILCASSISTSIMILGRILQGIGASLLMPCIAILIQRGFGDDNFGKAFGLILGFANFFYAIGPFVGGTITEYASWRWFFLLNIPVGLITLLFTHLTTSKDTLSKQHSSLDVKGLLTFIIGLSLLILAIMQGSSWSWGSIQSIACFFIAAANLFLFAKFEFSCKHPLLDLRLFKNKHFLAGNIILFCAAASLTVMVFWALWLQISLKFSPAIVGVALLPASLMFIFIPRLAGVWRDKSGAKTPLLLGTSLIFISLLWLILTASQQNYTYAFFGFLVFGLGIPLAIPVSVMTIMSSVNEEQSGMASGTYTTVRQFALTAGVAILSAIITAFKSGFSSKFNTAMTYTLSVRNAMIAALVLSAIAIACSLLLIKRS